MWKTIGIAAVVFVAAVLVFAATRPGEFEVTRSIAIKAKPMKIYPLSVDFRPRPARPPWEKLDPTMKRTLSDAASGAGAIYAWDGSGQGGRGPDGDQGRDRAGEDVIQLDFIRPFECHSVSDFTLAPGQSAGTQVTWLMRGQVAFVTKLLGIFVDMDGMIGKDFEAGLATSGSGGAVSGQAARRASSTRAARGIGATAPKPSVESAAVAVA